LSQQLLYPSCALATKRPRSKRRLEELAWVTPNAAGLDIGSAESGVAVPPDRDEPPVRACATCTPDLPALVAWLVVCGLATVVRESTGVFWGPRCPNDANNLACAATW
jgi:hypothetical protein